MQHDSHHTSRNKFMPTKRIQLIPTWPKDVNDEGLRALWLEALKHDEYWEDCNEAQHVNK